MSFVPRDAAALPPSRAANFLFLQGPASMFFSRLAAALRARGHQVRRVNFNGGDRAFWRLPNGVDYTGDRQNLPPFLARHFVEWSITDLVLLGDCRPLHRLAIETARRFGIETHIFEEGYIRPNWITLEHSGVNGFSELPRDLDSFLQAAARLDETPAPRQIASRLGRRALDDVCYAAATMAGAHRFRNYERHWPYGQLSEYTHGGRRLLLRGFTARARARALAELLASGRDFYVFPMQVDVDSQILFHSQFKSQLDVIQLILDSFARKAPRKSLLAITEHPLETSPKNWRRLVTEQAAKHGIAARVKFFAGGSPREMLAAARGIVVVNSTTGHQGLELGIPVIALSPAVFNLPGITFQKGLDRFWSEAGPADPDAFAAFRRVVIHRTQLNGGFFSDEGIAAAIASAVPRMEAASLRGARAHLGSATAKPGAAEPRAGIFSLPA